VRRRTAVRATIGAIAGVVALVVGYLAAALTLLSRVRRSALLAADALPTAGGSGTARRRSDPVDAILVFGATVDADGPSAELRARLDHAIGLWHAGAAPVVMVSGGVAGGIDEVGEMAAYLREHGMPTDRVRAVRPGENTRATLRSVAELGDQRYVAVSSPYHAHRIGVEARRLGLCVAVSVPSSTPETRHGRSHRVRLVTEVAALAFYALPPGVAARVNTGPGTLRHRIPHVLIGEASPISLLRPGPGRDR
jgi:uncharacterized SAM-binding protein YcdF (DUF218 family)